LSCVFDFGDSVDHACAEGGIDLFFALGDIERDDGGVGESAGEQASDHAFEVVAQVMFVSSHGKLVDK
jgi:hypothetical protein